MDRARAIAKLTAPGRKYELQNVCVNGNEVKWFVNAPTSLRQLISEARCEKTFFVYNDERYTFEEFYQRASNLGRRLIDDYGSNLATGSQLAFATTLNGRSHLRR